MSAIRLSQMKAVETFPICSDGSCDCMAPLNRSHSEKSTTKWMAFCTGCRREYDLSKEDALLRICVRFRYSPNWPTKDSRLLFHPDRVQHCTFDQAGLTKLLQYGTMVFPGFVPNYYTPSSAAYFEAMFYVWLEHKLPIDVRVEPIERAPSFSSNFRVAEVLSLCSVSCLSPSILIAFPEGSDKRLASCEIEDLAKAREETTQLRFFEIVTEFDDSVMPLTPIKPKEPHISAIGAIEALDYCSLAPGCSLTATVLFGFMEYYRMRIMGVEGKKTASMIKLERTHRLFLGSTSPETLRAALSTWTRPLILIPIRGVHERDVQEVEDWSLIVCVRSLGTVTHYTRKNRLNEDLHFEITRKLKTGGPWFQNALFQTKLMSQFQGDPHDSGLMVLDVAKWSFEAMSTNGSWHPSNMPAFNYSSNSYRKVLLKKLR